MQSRTVTGIYIDLEENRVNVHYRDEGGNTDRIDFGLTSREKTVQDLVETALNADS